MRQKLIAEENLAGVLERTRGWLTQSGFEDPNLKPDHLLLSFGPDNQLVKATLGNPEIRLCNFELVRRIPAAAG